MQLFAHDSHGCLILAKRAAKQSNYFCRECKGIVRVRGGMHRKAHFFHLQSNSTCRQNGKSLVHLQIQHYLQKLLTTRDCQLEYRFKEIDRIADVVWWPEKIIFEVQCSAITSEEIEQRNQDYARLGFQVVWILHDSRFNQQRLTPAELSLRGKLHYFTNIDVEGKGIIYDQFDFFHAMYRKVFLTKLSVNVLNIKRLNSAGLSFPIDFLNHRINSGLYFEGDLISLGLADENDFLIRLKHMEEAFIRIIKPKRSISLLLKLFMEKWVLRPYMNIFQIFLEGACR